MRGTLFTAALIAVSLSAASAQDVAIKKGAEFDAKLGTALSSKTNHSGDPFTLTYTGSFFHRHPELDGAVIDGHLENVRPASSTHKATMTFVFDDIRLNNGAAQPAPLKLVSVKTIEPKTHHLRDTALIVGGAVAGHVASGKTGMKGGTLAGAAGGFAVASSMKSDIVVKPGTVVLLRAEQPIAPGPPRP